MQLHSEFIILKVKALRHVHNTFPPVWGDPWRCPHTQENQVEIKMSCSSSADQTAHGEKAAQSRICEAEYHTRMLLEGTKRLFNI